MMPDARLAVCLWDQDEVARCPEKGTPNKVGKTILALFFLCLSCIAEPTANGLYHQPRLQSLMDSVTLHISFDNKSMLPEMAAGPRFIPKVLGPYTKKTESPIFETGRIGSALVLGSGAGIYSNGANIDFQGRGAMALWVKPLEWTRPNGSNIVFAMTAGSQFYLQRQGPLRSPEGKLIRSECIQFLVKASKAQKQFTSLVSYSPWKNGQWYLVVANWAWPKMEWSIDAGPFAAKALSGVPEKKFFGSLVIGARGGEKGLLDEVMVFNRPLNRNEVRMLFELSD
ncbi:MAG: hypothetical protein QF886_09060 [Planctomycetota bacterium]|jgi:hypothetical protein|nr:hypothetical protein [Planctomycetota bacterium]